MSQLHGNRRHGDLGRRAQSVRGFLLPADYKEEGIVEIADRNRACHRIRGRSRCHGR